MKVHMQAYQRQYMKRVSATTWELWSDEPHDFDYKIRTLDESEAVIVESVYQHFAEPMKKLIGE